MSDNVVDFPMQKRRYQMDDPKINSIRVCRECHRKFDMFDEDDAAEWHYGHDCEFE